MKKSRFNRFAPNIPPHRAVSLLGPVCALLLASPAFAVSTTGVTNTYNGSLTANGIGTNANWTQGAPFNSTGLGAYADLVFTGAASGSTFFGSGGSVNMNAESFNVIDGNSYALQVNSTNYSRYNIGATSNTGTGEVILPFTNSVSGVAQDLIYLTGGSDLTFNATNTGGGVAGEMALRQTGNFNIGTDSVLTMDARISSTSGTRDITITGDGTTIFNGANTYGGDTTVRGGTLEIAGTNTGNNYIINGLVNPSEPVLKLSNVNAIPATAVLVGSNSLSFDGIVDLSVAGAYTFDYYNRGNITFTASSGSPTTLNFTGVTLASRITSGANGGRKFSNGSSNLSIVFDSTLDIGGDVDANVTIDSTGSTTVTGGVISTGTNVRSLTKDGNGSLTLNGASAYAGTTTVTAGVLRLENANALPGGVGATGGTSSLIFTGTTGVIGLTAATGDFLRAVGPGADQVTANPNATAGEGESMGFAAYGGDRVVDFGASIQLAQASYAGDGLTLAASDSDSKVTVVNDINLANSSRSVRVRDGSAAVDAELSGVISSPGGTLVKIGGGTLALTGTNGYGSAGGGTSVLDGTLAVDGDSLSDTSELVIDGGNVQSTGMETVGTLFFGAVQQIAGTWGSSASSALPAFQDDTRFSGTGVVVVTTGPAAGDDYTTWSTSFGLENPWVTLGNPALNGEPTADPDADGVTNKQEYAFGLNPTSGASFNPITVQLDKTTAKFSYTRRATPVSTGLAYTVTTSTDLVAWPIDVTATSSGQAVTGTVDGVETVEVTLTGAPLTAPKLFVRMEAE